MADFNGRSSSPAPVSRLLIVVGQPTTADQKDSILCRIINVLQQSWDSESANCDIATELLQLISSSFNEQPNITGEEIIRCDGTKLSLTILINPGRRALVESLQAYIPSASDTSAYRHVIYAGLTVKGCGSWLLKDSVFTFEDFSKVMTSTQSRRHSVDLGQAVLRLDCVGEGQWTEIHLRRLGVKFNSNPASHASSVNQDLSAFRGYLSTKLDVARVEDLYEPSSEVGRIVLKQPTLYIFPAYEGNSAFFGVAGFTMAIDGGFGRVPAFWNMAKHTAKVDALLVTHVGVNNTLSLRTFLERKQRDISMAPDIGSVIFNCTMRKEFTADCASDRANNLLMVNEIEENLMLAENFRRLDLEPIDCAMTACGSADLQPICLYHKVGLGTLDMFVLNPVKDSRELREFLKQWNDNVNVGQYTSTGGMPLSMVTSICALLVWRPTAPDAEIKRILLPGSTPQGKLMESLEKVRGMAMFERPVCREIDIVTKKRGGQGVAKQPNRAPPIKITPSMMDAANSSKVEALISSSRIAKDPTISRNEPINSSTCDGEPLSKTVVGSSHLKPDHGDAKGKPMRAVAAKTSAAVATVKNESVSKMSVSFKSVPSKREPQTTGSVGLSVANESMQHVENKKSFKGKHAIKPAPIEVTPERKPAGKTPERSKLENKEKTTPVAAKTTASNMPQPKAIRATPPKQNLNEAKSSRNGEMQVCSTNHLPSNDIQLDTSQKLHHDPPSCFVQVVDQCSILPNNDTDATAKLETGFVERGNGADVNVADVEYTVRHESFQKNDVNDSYDIGNLVRDVRDEVHVLSSDDAHDHLIKDNCEDGYDAVEPRERAEEVLREDNGLRSADDDEDEGIQEDEGEAISHVMKPTSEVDDIELSSLPWQGSAIEVAVVECVNEATAQEGENDVLHQDVNEAASQEREKHMISHADDVRSQEDENNIISHENGAEMASHEEQNDVEEHVMEVMSQPDDNDVMSHEDDNSSRVNDARSQEDQNDIISQENVLEVASEEEQNKVEEHVMEVMSQPDDNDVMSHEDDNSSHVNDARSQEDQNDIISQENVLEVASEEEQNKVEEHVMEVMSQPNDNDIMSHEDDMSSHVNDARSQEDQNDIISQENVLQMASEEEQNKVKEHVMEVMSQPDDNNIMSHEDDMSSQVNDARLQEYQNYITSQENVLEMASEEEQNQVEEHVIEATSQQDDNYIMSNEDDISSHVNDAGSQEDQNDIISPENILEVASEGQNNADEYVTEVMSQPDGNDIMSHEDAVEIALPETEIIDAEEHMAETVSQDEEHGSIEHENSVEKTTSERDNDVMSHQDAGTITKESVNDIISQNIIRTTSQENVNSLISNHDETAHQNDTDHIVYNDNHELTTKSEASDAMPPNEDYLISDTQAGRVQDSDGLRENDVDKIHSEQILRAKEFVSYDDDVEVELDKTRDENTEHQAVVKTIYEAAIAGIADNEDISLAEQGEQQLQLATHESNGHVKLLHDEALVGNEATSHQMAETGSELDNESVIKDVAVFSSTGTTVNNVSGSCYRVENGVNMNEQGHADINGMDSISENQTEIGGEIKNGLESVSKEDNTSQVVPISDAGDNDIAEVEASSKLNPDDEETILYHNADLAEPESSMGYLNPGSEYEVNASDKVQMSCAESIDIDPSNEAPDSHGPVSHKKDSVEENFTKVQESNAITTKYDIGLDGNGGEIDMKMNNGTYTKGDDSVPAPNIFTFENGKAENYNGRLKDSSEITKINGAGHQTETSCAGPAQDVSDCVFVEEHGAPSDHVENYRCSGQDVSDDLPMFSKTPRSLISSSVDDDHSRLTPNTDERLSRNTPQAELSVTNQFHDLCLSTPIDAIQEPCTNGTASDPHQTTAEEQVRMEVKVKPSPDAAGIACAAQPALEVKANRFLPEHYDEQVVRNSSETCDNGYEQTSVQAVLPVPPLKPSAYSADGQTQSNVHIAVGNETCEDTMVNNNLISDVTKVNTDCLQNVLENPELRVIRTSEKHSTDSPNRTGDFSILTVDDLGPSPSIQQSADSEKAADHDKTFTEQVFAHATIYGQAEQNGSSNAVYDPVAEWGQPSGLPMPTHDPTGKTNATGDSSVSAQNRSLQQVPPASVPGPRPKPDERSTAKKPVAADKSISSPPKTATAASKPTTVKKTDTAKAQQNTAHQGLGTVRPVAPGPVGGKRVDASNKVADSTNRKPANKLNKPAPCYYVDLAYIPGNGSANSVDLDFFRQVRARHYVLSCLEPSPQILDALLLGRQSWNEHDMEVTLIPTYESPTLQGWKMENREDLERLQLVIAPAADLCKVLLPGGCEFSACKVEL